MNYCAKCHRQMKHASEDGLGPVCRKRAKPLPTHERDLFGFNVSLACEAATVRMRVFVESLSVAASIGLRHSCAQARRRLGVWA